MSHTIHVAYCHKPVTCAKRCTATHCNKLQQTATHCNTLQHDETHCNTLQHTATHCNTLQHTCNSKMSSFGRAVDSARLATHCNTLQHIATHCNTMQHTATHCNTLQHTAVRCNIPATAKYRLLDAQQIQQDSRRLVPPTLSNTPGLPPVCVCL